MTRKESYIKNVLCKQFRLSEATAKTIYEETDKVLHGGDQKKYESFKGMYSPHFQTVISAATAMMSQDTTNYLGLDMNEEIDTAGGYID